MSRPVPKFRCEYDGFVGELIGEYVTREGEIGLVLQQIGTKVVHVYRRDRLTEIRPLHPVQS